MERAVRANGHAAGNRGADNIVRCTSVEFLSGIVSTGMPGCLVGSQEYFAEVHALHAFATKCRTDRRRRRGLPSANDELDDDILRSQLARHASVRDAEARYGE